MFEGAARNSTRFCFMVLELNDVQGRTLSRLYADLMPAIRLRFSCLLYFMCVNPGVGVLVVVGIVVV